MNVIKHFKKPKTEIFLSDQLYNIIFTPLSKHINILKNSLLNIFITLFIKFYQKFKSINRRYFIPIIDHNWFLEIFRRLLVQHPFKYGIVHWFIFFWELALSTLFLSLGCLCNLVIVELEFHRSLIFGNFLYRTLLRTFFQLWLLIWLLYSNFTFCT